MRESETYRQYAQECRKLAAKMKDPKHRKSLEEIAEAWTLVANEGKHTPRTAMHQSDMQSPGQEEVNRDPRRHKA